MTDPKEVWVSIKFAARPGKYVRYVLPPDEDDLAMLEEGAQLFTELLDNDEEIRELIDVERDWLTRYRAYTAKKAGGT